MMLLPLSHNVIMLTILAMLMSAGNGLSSGIIITLGADVAPPLIRLRFFSIWRVMSDTGNALGPIAVSAIATIATLATGIVAVGAFGPLAAAGMARWVPRYSPFATRRMMRDRRQEITNARLDPPEDTGG
jgi:MFS family permease